MDNQDYKVLYEKQKELFDKFLYLFTHDFKGYIRNLNSLSEWIVEDVKAEDYSDLPSNAALMEKTVKHLNLVMDALYDYSKCKIELYEAEMIPLKDFIKDTAKAFNVELTIHGDDEIKASRQLLFWLFRELLKNTEAYSEEKKLVEIDIKRENGAILIDYRDTSKGMSENDFSKALEPLKVIHNDKEKVCAGLGLAIVQKVVDEYGGSITYVPKEEEGLHLHLLLMA